MYIKPEKQVVEKGKARKWSYNLEIENMYPVLIEF